MAEIPTQSLNHYTIKQVAEMLKLSERTVRRYVSEGTIHSVHIGVNVRIPEDSLKAFIENQNK